MNPYSPFLFALLILFQTNVMAASRALTWEECLKLAAAQNEELKSSEKNLEAADHQFDAAYGSFFPQVSGSLNYTNSTAASVTQDAYGASITATQSVFNGFQDKAKVDQARANRDLAKIALQTERAKTSYDLKNAIASLQYTQNYLTLAESIRQRRELNSRTVQLRFESGRENKGALLLSRAYFEDAKLDYLRAQQNLNIAQTTIVRVLGLESTDDVFQFKGEIPIADPAAEGNVNFKSLVLETSSYLQSVAQESSAKASLNIAQSNFYPSLNLSASAGDSGNTWYPTNHGRTLGASLTFPLFSGGRDYNSTKAAGASLLASQLDRAGSLKQQLVTLQTSYASFVQAVQKLKVDQVYTEALTVRERVSRQKYNNGLSTFDDWDVIENDLIKRQKDLLASQRDRILAEASWEQAQGKGVLP